IQNYEKNREVTKSYKSTACTTFDAALERMDVQMKLANNAFATRENYIRGVRALILHYQRLPEQCSVHEIKAFLVHQRDDQQYSSSTVNLRVCALKYYFREVVHRLDLVVKIPNPRVSKFDVEVLTIEEIKRMQRACRDVRQLLVLNLIYDTGLPKSEKIWLGIQCKQENRYSEGEKSTWNAA
ncbi:MAG: phage integrase N-terminal SAM-like domain-containing protein, partial [Bacteroidota bacterium]